MSLPRPSETHRASGRRVRLLAAAIGAAAAFGALPFSAAALADTSTDTTATTSTTTSTTATSTTATTPTTTTTTTTSAPTSTPIAGKLLLSVTRLFTVKGQTVSVPDFRTVLSGAVSDYVAGQTVTLTLRVHGRVFRTATIAVRADARGNGGYFKLAYSVPRSGWVSISASHAATNAQAAFAATRNYLALNESVRAGATGRFVQLLQQRLAALHVFVPQTGVYDTYTQLAVDAYHRLLGWGESATLSRPLINHLLLGLGRFHIRYPGQGRHAEGDLSDQVLALINGSQVQMLFPISSGKPSTPTVLGNFRVYYQVPGYLPDGMYYSSFFTGGYAIHGYDPAPDYPASHGCMRLPIIDAITAYEWISVGDWVDTYYT